MKYFKGLICLDPFCSKDYKVGIKDYKVGGLFAID